MNTVKNSCVYLNCVNNRKTCENLTFFKFPTDINRKSVWIENCGNIQLLNLENLSAKVICEKHFDAKFVINSGPRKLLVKHAVPYHHATVQPSTSSASNMIIMTDQPHNILEVYIKEENISEVYIKEENMYIKEEIKEEEEIADLDPLRDDNHPTGVIKHRSGKALNRGQKILAFNIFISRSNKGESKTKSVKYTASQIGISEKSVWSIMKEYERTGEFASPSLKRTRAKADEKLNEEQKNTLKRIVHSFLEKNEAPTVSNLLEAVRLNELIPTMSRTTLWKVLNKLGFKYGKKGSMVYVYDGQDLGERSSHILEKSKKSKGSKRFQ